MNTLIRATCLTACLLVGPALASAAESGLREGRYMFIPSRDEPKDSGGPRLKVAEVEILTVKDALVFEYVGCPEDQFPIQAQGGGFVITIGSKNPPPKGQALSTMVLTGSVTPTDRAEDSLRYDGSYSVHTPWGTKSGIFALIKVAKPEAAKPAPKP
jgi:hypothetical protein